MALFLNAQRRKRIPRLGAVYIWIMRGACFVVYAVRYALKRGITHARVVHNAHKSRDTHSYCYKCFHSYSKLVTPISSSVHAKS